MRRTLLTLLLATMPAALARTGRPRAGQTLATRRAPHGRGPLERRERIPRVGSCRDRCDVGSPRQRLGTARPADAGRPRDRHGADDQRRRDAAADGAHRRRPDRCRRRRRWIDDARIVGGSTRIYRPSLAYREDGDRIVALNDEGKPTDENWWRRLERRREGNWSEAAPHRAGGRLQPRRRIADSARSGDSAVDAVGQRALRRRGDHSHRHVVRVADRATSDTSCAAKCASAVSEASAIGGQHLRRRRADRSVAAVRRRDGARRVRRAARLPRLLPATRRHWLAHAVRRTQPQPLRLHTAPNDGRRARCRIPSRSSIPIATGGRIPSVDEGLFHIADLALKFDTRTDPADPWSGWYCKHGHRARAAARSRPPRRVRTRSPSRRARRTNTRAASSTSVATTASGRARSSTCGPWLGGWLGGDQMPIERRLSVDGPGTLPGFGFRTTRIGLDRGDCNIGNVADRRTGGVRSHRARTDRVSQ